MAGVLRGELSGRKGGIAAEPVSRHRKFLVISDDRNDYDGHILTTPGLPGYNDIHPYDATIRVKKMTASQDSDVWWKWEVDVEYDPPTATDDPENNEYDNPLLRLPEISINTQSIMLAARGEVDSSGVITKAIENSAGEVFDPHPEEEVEILVINITRWAIANFSVATYKQYQNSVNSDPWTFGDSTAAEGEAKIRLAIGKREFWRNPATNTIVSYRQYDFEIMVSPIGWDIKLLDWGTAFKDGGVSIKFIDYPNVGQGNEFGKLDGSGGKLAPGVNPVFRTWKNKKRVSFGPLNLPTGP